MREHCLDVQYNKEFIQCSVSYSGIEFNRLIVLEMIQKIQDTE